MDGEASRGLFVGVEAKVDFLRQADVYPEPTGVVEVIETHMAWVFLTTQHAYKLKKPVHRTDIDFRTVAARRADSEAEVRLNRRLAPAVYLGTVPLTLDARGQLHLDGPGDAVDWLVQMQRLPAEQMLDRRIEEGDVPEASLRRAAEKLARFYATAPPAEGDPAAYRSRLAERLQAMQRALDASTYRVPMPLARDVVGTLQAFLQREVALLGDRVRAGRIIEAHGDLQPEHICLTPDPKIFDCLEFSRELRILDTASELSFFAMECDRLGAPWIGTFFFRTYAGVTGDRPPGRLRAFYRGFWACGRAYLAVQHTRRPDEADPSQWSRQARQYLQQAEAYAQDLR